MLKLIEHKEIPGVAIQNFRLTRQAFDADYSLRADIGEQLVRFFNLQLLRLAD